MDLSTIVLLVGSVVFLVWLFAFLLLPPKPAPIASMSLPIYYQPFLEGLPPGVKYEWQDPFCVIVRSDGTTEKVKVETYNGH